MVIQSRFCTLLLLLLLLSMAANAWGVCDQCPPSLCWTWLDPTGDVCPYYSVLCVGQEVNWSPQQSYKPCDPSYTRPPSYWGLCDDRVDRDFCHDPEEIWDGWTADFRIEGLAYRSIPGTGKIVFDNPGEGYVTADVTDLGAPGCLDGGTWPMWSAFFTVVKVKRIKVVSGAIAIADGPNTPADTDVCAAVKPVEGDAGYVILEAELDPAVTEPPSGFSWSGGEAVDGNKLQRKVSKSTWSKTTVTASCCTSVAKMIVYVIGAQPTGFSPENGTLGNHYDDNETSWPDLSPLPIPQNKTGIWGPWEGYGMLHHSRCEIEFTVEPSALVTDRNGGLFDASAISWDVSREKKFGWLLEDSQGWRTQHQLDQQWISDDTTSQGEDNNPWNGNGHLYSSDAPLCLLNPPPSNIIGSFTLWLMREFVNCTLSGGAGGRCSDYKNWHCRRCVVRSGSDWINDNTTYGTNEIKAD